MNNEIRCKMMMGAAWVYYTIALVVLACSIGSGRADLLSPALCLFMVFVACVAMSYTFSVAEDNTVSMFVKGAALVVVTPIFIVTSIINWIVDLSRGKKGDEYYDD